MDLPTEHANYSGRESIRKAKISSGEVFARRAKSRLPCLGAPVIVSSLAPLRLSRGRIGAICRCRTLALDSVSHGQQPYLIELPVNLITGGNFMPMPLVALRHVRLSNISRPPARVSAGFSIVILAREALLGALCAETCSSTDNPKHLPRFSGFLNFSSSELPEHCSAP